MLMITSLEEIPVWGEIVREWDVSIYFSLFLGQLQHQHKK